MPGWQRFVSNHRAAGWSLISIAVEHGDPAAARPFAARWDFPTLIDANGELARHFGFKAVPNGVLVDDHGVVRWSKFGGFSIDNPEDVAAVERFLAGDDPGQSADAEESDPLGPLARDLVATKVRLGHALLMAARRDEAVAAWRDALRLDPRDFTVRKQIWAVEHPERFYPTIDVAWQGPQLAAERAREIADGICDPDGCPIPATAPRPGATSA